MTRSTAILVLAAALAWASAAQARSYTPNLKAFYLKDGAGNVVPDIAKFKGYSAELATAMAPKFQGPGATLGSMGYELTLTVGLADINADDYWKGAASDPGDLLVTNQFRFRKGLPYSLQLGGFVTHLYQSDLWGIGLELGWSLNEGFRYFPDIAIVTSVGTLLGAEDLALLQVGMAALLSKSFSIAGLFALEPYAGYNFMYVNASSHRVATLDLEATQHLPEAIGLQNIFRHSAVLGLNSVITYLTLGFEVGLGSDQRTYSFKVGTQF